MPASSLPSRRPSPGGHLLLAATLLLGAANAQIQNGDFENPTPLFGWTAEYSSYTGAGFGPWVLAQPVGHPTPGLLLASTPQPFGVSFLPIQTYEGTQSALLNDPQGGSHATRLTQTFSPTASDVASGTLAVQWGAMLESAHPGQPGFRVEVFLNNASVLAFAATTTNAIAEGWQTTGPGSDFYYKHGQVEVTFPPLLTTDNIRVELWSWDCNAGGHGGFAVFDDVRFLTCTNPPRQMVGWWHDSTGKDLAGPTANNGVWNAAALATGGYVGGDGLRHASTNFLSVPDHALLDFKANTSFSIDLWVQPASVAPGLQPLLSKVFGGPAWHQLGYALYLDDGHPALMLGDYSGPGLGAYVAASTVIPAAEWTHLAVTVERRTSAVPAVKFFVNGAELGDTFVPLLTSLDNGKAMFAGSGLISPDLRIGQFSDNFFTWAGGVFGAGVAGTLAVFDGETDEIEFFRRALDPIEVRRVFAAGTRGKCKAAYQTMAIEWVSSGSPFPITSGNDVLSAVTAAPFPIALDGTNWTHWQVSTNGFLYLSNGGAAPGPSTGFGPAGTMVANLRNGPPRIAPFWCDLDLQPADNAGVYYDTFTNPDRMVFTWVNAVEVGHATPKSFQCQIFATGEIVFAYADGIAAEGGNVLCGISTGGGLADPGASDLDDGAFASGPILYQNFDAAALPFDLAGTAVMLLPNDPGYEAIAEPLGVPGHTSVGVGCLGMALHADVAPLPGSTVTYATNGMPEYAPGLGIYLGMTVISFGQIPGGLDLGILGAPGCNAYVASLDITMSMLGFTANQAVALPLPTSVPSGLQFVVQSVALAPPANPGGLVTSNGVLTTIP